MYYDLYNVGVLHLHPRVIFPPKMFGSFLQPPPLQIKIPKLFLGQSYVQKRLQLFKYIPEHYRPDLVHKQFTSD